MSKQVTILGSTGSIGTQSLNVCKRRGFQIVGLTAHSNIDLLEKQIVEFSPKLVAVGTEELAEKLKKRINVNSTKIIYGIAGFEEVASSSVDVVVNAISGIAGLRPTIAAINSKNNLALANKEALVVGGELVMSLARKNKVSVFPVDSEHSAIWQCLHTGKREHVSHVILTASGGPFRGKTRNELVSVTVKETLQHPTWSMGQKISVDSATLMNKGLEFIEAMWLFDLKPEEIQVVVHPQSIVHSAVSYRDGSTIAQMGNPDMRVAIQYAMTYPDREELDVEPLALAKLKSLTFENPDMNTFTCLKTCIKAVKLGGHAPSIVNGANEEAVKLFLQEKIDFLQIGDIVSKALEEVHDNETVTIDSLEKADKLARDFVRKTLI